MAQAEGKSVYEESSLCGKLNENIRPEISAISIQQLHCVSGNTFS
jgi:hypothetical protein